MRKFLLGSEPVNNNNNIIVEKNNILQILKFYKNIYVK